MEPITAIASAIATLIFTEAFKEGGKALGKGATEKSVQLINTIREKFQASGTEGLLTRAEKQPSERNIEIVEGELVTQMEEDEAFANQLRELVQQLKQEGVISNSPASVNVNQSSSIGNVTSGSNTTIGDINTYRST